MQNIQYLLKLDVVHPVSMLGKAAMHAMVQYAESIVKLINNALF
jgi:hypothetical protein